MDANHDRKQVERTEKVAESKRYKKEISDGAQDMSKNNEKEISDGAQDMSKNNEKEISDYAQYDGKRHKKEISDGAHGMSKKNDKGGENPKWMLNAQKARAMVGLSFFSLIFLG